MSDSFGGGKIPSGDHQYRIQPSRGDDLEKTKAKILSEKNEVFNGRLYRFVDVQEKRGAVSKFLHALVATAGIVGVAIGTLGGVFASSKGRSLIGRMWKWSDHGKTKHVAVQTNIVDVARRQGVIPTSFTEFKNIMPFYLEEVQDMYMKGTLGDVISERRHMLSEQKESMSGTIEASELQSLDTYKALRGLEKAGTFEPVEGGAGGAYCLKNSKGTTQFIIKPNDEDVFCMNNRKNVASIQDAPDYRVKTDIPNYQSAQNEALASRISEHLGLATVIPKTVMVVLKNDGFHDFMDGFPLDSAELGLDAGIDKVKLCSAQAFVPNSKDLQEFQIGKSPEELRDSIDQGSFEDANIIMWTILENDGHSGNFRVAPIEGSSKSKLIKIDSGLSSPDKNTGLTNCLASMLNAEKKLSDSAKEKINNIPIDDISEDMLAYGKSPEAVEAFKARIVELKSLGVPGMATN